MKGGGPAYEQRKRLVRLSEAEMQAAGPYVSLGRHYVDLAEAVVLTSESRRLSAGEDRIMVLHQLLANAGEFDPDPTREALTGVEGLAAMRTVLAQLRALVLQDCPQLPAYFSMIASQRLRARQLTWDEWLATDDGKLVGEGGACDQLMFSPDEFEQDADDLADIQRGELAPERLYDGFLLNNAVAGVAATWPRFTLGRMTLVSPISRDETVAAARAEWIIQLALAPMGSARLDDGDDAAELGWRTSVRIDR